MKTHLIKGMILMLMIVLLWVSWTGRLNEWTGYLGKTALDDRNAAYLDQTLDRALAGFATLSVIKAGLDIIEGSSVGASFGMSAEIEVGDIVQPVYDYVDIAWKTLMGSCLILLSIKFLLQTADFLSIYVLSATLLIGLMYLAQYFYFQRFKRIGYFLGSCGLTSLWLAIIVYYALPLAIMGSSKLSTHITEPSIMEAQTGFEQARSEFFSDKSFGDKGWIGTARQLEEKIKSLAVTIETSSRLWMTWALKLIAGYVFDCLVFPCGSFLIIYGLTRFVLRQLSTQRADPF
jgi:hypothetical protein